MTKKKEQPVRKFEAKVGLNSDVTGKRFEPGDIVTEADFETSILEHWLKQGKLVELKE